MKTTKQLLKIALIATFLMCGCSKKSSTHVHNFRDEVIKPTCESQGFTRHTCLSCGYKFEDSYVNALGHDYSVFEKTTGDLEGDVGDEIYSCSRCHKQQATNVSHLNCEDKGVIDLALGDYLLSIEDGYEENCITLIIENISLISNGEIYYSFSADYGLFYHQSFKLTFNAVGNSSTYAYENGEYPYKVNFNCYVIDEESDAAIIQFYYADYGLTRDTALGKFAFYPLLVDSEGTYEYDQLNPYVVKTYSETWVKVNNKGRFYYSTRFQTHEVENWTRPDITKAETNWTQICRASTPEEAIVSGLVGQEKGATNIDVNLLYLNPIYRNKESFEKIFKHFKDIGTISVYYNSEVSQEERLATLKLSVEAGAGGIDLQGFMFHSGSTLTTHTDENIQYWEDRGYDMSFIYASPKETTIDPEEDAKQIEYINEIHALGGKVLQSCHISTQLTRRQAVAFGEFLNHRNVDIIKLVSLAKNVPSFEDTVLANVDAYYSNKITAKYSIHTTNSSMSDISRVIGPLFYHTYMAFHYTNLCKLQMIMDIKNSGISLDDSTSISDSINLIKGKTSDPELNYLINEYAKLDKDANYAFGKSSDLSDRWSSNGNTTTLTMRTSSGTNTFSIRGISTKGEYKAKDFEFETSLSGNMKPYTSSSRLPKFGIYLGGQGKMVALTYNFSTSSGVGSSYAIGLMTNSYYFGFDTKTKDALDTKVMEPVSIASNIVNGDNVRLKVKYVNGDLSLYYSLESSGEYVFIKTYLYDEIKDLFIHDLDKSVSFGLVAEAYMGSASVGMDNVINYSSNASINS